MIRSTLIILLLRDALARWINMEEQNEEKNAFNVARIWFIPQ